MYKPGAFYILCFSYFFIQVQRVRGIGSGDIRQVVRFHYSSYVLRVLALAQYGCGTGDSAQGCGARALVAGVHIAFIVIADVDEIFLSLCGSAQRLKAYIMCATIAG